MDLEVYFEITDERFNFINNVQQNTGFWHME